MHLRLKKKIDCAFTGIITLPFFSENQPCLDFLKLEESYFYNYQSKSIVLKNTNKFSTKTVLGSYSSKLLKHILLNIS